MAAFTCERSSGIGGSASSIKRHLPSIREAGFPGPCFANRDRRLLGILWSIPAERGGGQDKAMEGYEQGLEKMRKTKVAASETLDPTWGEPELLMSLGWSNLNRSTPDLQAAEQNARAALALVPHWHYVRDILLPQILKAKAAA